MADLASLIQVKHNLEDKELNLKSEKKRKLE
jgi:hypothetical protein